MDLSKPGAVAAHARLVTRFGVGIEPWWRALTGVVDELLVRWRIEVVDIVGRGGTSIVLACRLRGGAGRAYLKLTPDLAIAAAEAATLDGWASTERVPRVLERDLAAGALLLAAVGDGRPVAETGEMVSLPDVAALITALHGAEPLGESFAPPLAERVSFTFDRLEARFLAAARHAAPGAVAGAELARGRALALELTASAPSTVLLHGDLHPGNVLVVDGRPVAIDPRPCVGDPAFDLVDWVAWQAEPAAWRERSDRLAHLTGIDAERAWGWFAAFAALVALPEIANAGGMTNRAAALLAVAA